MCPKTVAQNNFNLRTQKAFKEFFKKTQTDNSKDTEKE